MQIRIVTLSHNPGAVSDAPKRTRETPPKPLDRETKLVQELPHTLDQVQGN